jgi:hypothetical protein
METPHVQELKPYQISYDSDPRDIDIATGSAELQRLTAEDIQALDPNVNVIKIDPGATVKGIQRAIEENHLHSAA